ncbi:MAG: methionyl-tRNA formyltransferase [Candidatus Taylorbacteria bacterium]|nr:methionyl-tRNA formyltransferase [Candidatus Taylorbacteria bacterium]
MTNKPRIAFFGTPDLAVWVLDALKEKGVVPDLVIAAPDAPKGRKLVLTPPPAKSWADTNKVPVLQPASLRTPEFEEELRSRGPWDLFVVAAYGKLIPESVLYMPKRKTINVHPSLLPLLRGAAPLQSAILNDMRETGVTIMRLDEKIDHGPILAQEKSRLSSWPVDQETLGRHLSSLGGELIAKLLPAILSGEAEEIEQDHSKATYTEKISKENGLLDLEGDGYRNFLKWNAYKGWPGTYFFIEKNGKKTRISVTEAGFEKGGFVLKRVIPEGKKEMSGEEFERWAKTA